MTGMGIQLGLNFCSGGPSIGLSRYCVWLLTGRFRPMKRSLCSILSAAVLVGLSAVCGAQLKGVMSPEEAGKNTARLLSNIRWTTSLDDAKSEARKSGKLIFWVHMRGKIDGLT